MQQSPFGTRVLQTGTSTTTIYPFKWYSVASSTGTGAKYSTTTDYVFNGDTLVSTIDQQLASGVATGTAQTRYIHLDHLGSTNVVTDASGTVVQTLDYYPYGATRISSGQNAESRQYIGQFTDNSGLSYLNARYYNGTQGQFLSQDPIFLGDPRQQKLQDPQSLNSYSYSEDNPITKSDPSGKFAPAALLPAAYGLGDLGLASTVEFWGPPVAIGAIGAGAIILASNGWQDVVQNAQNYNNNRGGNYRYVPFSEQGRQIQLPGSPDPLDPWDGWKLGNPNDWKTWVGTGLGVIGAATDIYQQAQDLPSNNQSGAWTALPPIVIQGGSSYYRNSSGLLSTTPQNSTGQQGQSGGSGSASFNAQVSSIQAQINQIQAQINAIAQSRSNSK